MIEVSKPPVGVRDVKWTLLLKTNTLLLLLKCCSNRCGISMSILHFEVCFNNDWNMALKGRENLSDNLARNNNTLPLNKVGTSRCSQNYLFQFS